MPLESKIKLAWSGETKWNCSVAGYTTLGVGGEASAVVEPENTEQLSSLLQGLTKHNIPRFILGRGSNVIVADNGIAGVVILLAKKFEKITIDAASKGLGAIVKVKVQAGCSLTRLINYCAEKDIGGLEFAAGIPGSIGGAVAMNAGAWGHDMGEVVDSVELLATNGEMLMQKTKPGDFSYRQWLRPEGGVIATVNLLLKRSDRTLIQTKCAELVAKRRQKQPRGNANCGSFFKNPPGDAAGRLIEQASLKGLTIGKAQVSEEHANFFINLGGARAVDFYKLGVKVKESVMAKSGIMLEPEVKFVGRWPQEFSCLGG